MSLQVYPESVSPSAQAVFFVASASNRKRLEQLQDARARLWQGSTLMHSFDT